MKSPFLTIPTALFIAGSLAAQPQGEAVSEAPKNPLLDALNQIVVEQRSAYTGTSEFDALFTPRAKVIEATPLENGSLEIVFDSSMGQRSWNAESAAALEAVVLQELSKKVSDSSYNDLELAIAYGNTASYDVLKIGEWFTTPEQVRKRQEAVQTPVAPLTKPVLQTPDYAGPERTEGLVNKNFVISPSHGWTWHFENRWQLQRARVYTIVEDLFPQSSVNPFLIPMLENAGAVVWSTRERSYQTAEVIVDNAGNYSDHDFIQSGTWQIYEYKGWQGGRPAALNERDEPFRKGNALTAQITDGQISSAQYVPFIPETGDYPVYASWIQSGQNSDSVPIIINHAGGSTTVRVNQRVAGSTWVYLGTFPFTKGKSAETGSVTVTTEGAALHENNEVKTSISADAIRFGGGMGNIAVEDQVSGKPRYAEAAKYYLQYAGAPYEFVTNVPTGEGHFGGDYNQDIVSRGEYPNWLQGSPNGLNAARDYEGLGVPVDAMVSWHTDAGGEEDGIIGTLMLYQIEDNAGKPFFPDGRSRWLNRDLAVYIMDEYTRTIRSEFSSTWPKRDLRKVGFGEIRRPNTPSVIIELLSHHNFNDMKYGNDPRFKKATARSVYKALARFMADSTGTDVVITPLEPAGVSLHHQENGLFRLSIVPQADPLEPTAVSTHYIVYRSKDGVAYDNGTLFTSEQNENGSIQLQIPDGETAYFKVAAANAGGQSLPSSVVGGSTFAELGTKRVLIVDGFDRISGPEIVERPGAQGFDRSVDPGVGYHYTYGLVGDQYDFDYHSEWKNDLETPGRGASLSNKENTLEVGNQFNHVVAYGEILKNHSVPFDSVSRQGFSSIMPSYYSVIIWIGGEQKTVPPYAQGSNQREGMPSRMKNEFPLLTADQASILQEYIGNGGKLIISGSYAGSELLSTNSSPKSRELATSLGLQGFHSQATRINSLVPATQDAHFAGSTPARFGRDLEGEISIEPLIYSVENAEAYTANADAVVLYGDTQTTAGFISANGAVFGFPLETVLPQSERERLIIGSLRTLWGEAVPEKTAETK